MPKRLIALTEICTGFDKFLRKKDYYLIGTIKIKSSRG